MAPGACKIRSGCNVPQVPSQLIPLGVPWTRDGLTTYLKIKIARPFVYGLLVGLNPRRRTVGQNRNHAAKNQKIDFFSTVKRGIF